MNDHVRPLTPLTEEQAKTFYLLARFGEGLFVLLLTLSALNCFIAERSAEGFMSRFYEAMPLVFGILGGAIVAMGAWRGEISRRVEGPLLMMLGLLMHFAYELVPHAR